MTPPAQLHQGQYMAHVGMHAAVGYHPEQVQGSVSIARLLDGIAEGVIIEETAVFNRGVDTHQVLAQNAAATQSHMSNLGVAHLTWGQPDRGSRSLQHRMRIAGEIIVQARGMRLENRVIAFAGIDSETVKND